MKGTIPWQTAEDWPHRLAALEIDPQRTALIIVDMQNYSDIYMGILPQCQCLLDFFRTHHLPVIHLRVGSLLPNAHDVHLMRRLNWLRTSEDKAARSCPKGSFDYDIVAELSPWPGELVVDKNSSGAFNSTAIDHYLRAFEVHNLVICGEATSRCVENTARSAADRGYNVILVSDACADHVPQNHETTFHTFARAFGAVKTAEQVIAELSGLLSREPALSLP